MTTLAPQPQYPHQSYPNQSIMEDASDDGDDDDDEQFYEQQAQQAMYYQQHQQQQISHAGPAQQANLHTEAQERMEDEETYSDDSSMASIPDENINFSLHYAL